MVCISHQPSVLRKTDLCSSKCWSKLGVGQSLRGWCSPLSDYVYKSLKECWPREYHKKSADHVQRRTTLFGDVFSHDQFFQLASHQPKLCATHCFGLYNTGALMFKACFVLGVLCTAGGFL